MQVKAHSRWAKTCKILRMYRALSSVLGRVGTVRDFENWPGIICKWRPALHQAVGHARGQKVLASSSHLACSRPGMMGAWALGIEGGKS